uniref:Uncharacterized protein n=1 Tax=Pseudictyota dubia TaxID=2749911 RepID=A0A7R9VTH5_9STRA|mmetsp:Transcript_22929/g.42567  ORF Transcript_22929/g.42567 Transcript_22929/m.42567 type:complete len:127 (+) Transcript_22929:390-770(+)
MEGDVLVGSCLLAVRRRRGQGSRTEDDDERAGDDPRTTTKREGRLLDERESEGTNVALSRPTNVALSLVRPLDAGNRFVIDEVVNPWRTKSEDRAPPRGRSAPSSSRTRPSPPPSPNPECLSRLVD